MVEGEEKLRPTMSALAILSCRPNSHPFQERHISLHEAVKIGRSVARARPSVSNGIFDCKVLSRHHAMLWYETGKFYLQDTKSSNGTFINNQRLCKGGEESPAREVYSGDLIQFGVEVMENNRRGEKITHGCIIATITLYHPDGREAKPTPFLCGENIPGISLQTQDLYQLAQYLQEALHRENMLEQKLLTLQQLVHNTQKASESGWQALIDEDKLLSRLEMLENQLHIYSKNHSEDTLRQELVALQEDKNKYETTSKESLRRVLQEKLEAVTKLSDLEQSLDNMKEECGHLKEVCESSQSELGQLAEKYQEQLKEVSDLQEKLQEAEQNHNAELERTEAEKAEISQKLEEMIQQETALSAKIESLQADNDFTKEQLAAMKAKLESIKESSNEDDEKLTEHDLNSSTHEEIDIIPLDPPKEDDVPENLEAKLKDLQKHIEVYKGKLETSDTKLKESNEKVEQLQKDLDVAISNSKEYLVKITSLEVQLKESAKQSHSSNDLIEAVKDHIQQVEKELTIQTPVNSVVNSTDSLESSQHEDSKDNETDQPQPLPQSPATDGTAATSAATIGGPPDLISTTVVLNGSRDTSEEEQDADTTMVSPSSVSSSVPDLEHDEGLKALLEEARQAQNKAEIELKKIRDVAQDSECRLKQSSDEISSLKTQLEDAQQQAKEKADLVIDLQDQVKKAESFTQDVKQQILDLREQLETERNKSKSIEKELEDAKMLLATSQQNAKQNHNETEHLREYQAVKEECANLRKRIQAIEAEMKITRKENLHLSSEYNKLQESYRQLESLKTKLETSEVSWRVNLTDAQKDAHIVRQELEEARTELLQLRMSCDEKTKEVTSLQLQISELMGDYQNLQNKSRMMSLVSSIPLLMLLFAVLMAIYPTLEAITSSYS